jgi:branched-chain amino acid transport system substrate-binding protein
MNIKKTISIAVVSSLVLLLLAVPLIGGCKAEAPAAKTLKIGAGMPLTGPLSMVGAVFQNAFEMAFDKINEEGGLEIGGDTYMVQLLLEDSMSTPDGATTAANRLVYEQDVKFLIADFWDPDTPGFYSVTSEAGVLLIRCYGELSSALEGGSMFDVGPEKPLCIRLAPTDNEVMEPPIEYLVNNYPDVETVGLVDMDVPMWAALEPYTASLLGNYGLEVAGEYTRFPMDAQDFYPIVTPVLQNNPGALYVLHGSLDQFVLIVKTARESGFNGPICYSTQYDVGLASDVVPNLSNCFGNGVILSAPNLPDSIQEVVDMGQERYGTGFISDMIHAYDVPMLLAQLLEEAQSLDPQTVQDTFETLTEPGSLQSVFGPAYVGGLQSTGVNRVLVRPAPMCRMVNGQGEYLESYVNDVP